MGQFIPRRSDPFQSCFMICKRCFYSDENFVHQIDLLVTIEYKF